MGFASGEETEGRDECMMAAEFKSSVARTRKRERDVPISGSVREG